MYLKGKTVEQLESLLKEVYAAIEDRKHKDFVLKEMKANKAWPNLSAFWTDAPNLDRLTRPSLDDFAFLVSQWMKECPVRSVLIVTAIELDHTKPRDLEVAIETLETARGWDHFDDFVDPPE